MDDEEEVRPVHGNTRLDLVEKWGGNMDTDFCDVWPDGSGILRIRDKEEKCSSPDNRFSSTHIFKGIKDTDYSKTEEVPCYNCNKPFRVPRL